MDDLNPLEKEAVGARLRVKSGIAEWLIEDLEYCDDWRNVTYKFPRTVWFNVIGQFADPVVLFRRRAFKEVENRLAEGGKYVWLDGPRGSGKSISAFFFARDLSMRSHGPKRRRILWLSSVWQPTHLIDRGCVFQVGPGTEDLCKFEDISEIFVDQYGCTPEDDSQRFERHILPWSRQSTHRKVYLIPVLDMDPPCVDPFDWNMVIVPPWTIQDYEEALMIPEMKEQFLQRTNLYDTVSNAELMSAAREHFYYAGGSARYFFTRTISAIIEELNNSPLVSRRGMECWSGRFRSSKKSQQFLCGYAALVVGSTLSVKRFTDEISRFEKVDDVAIIFEAFVISCIANRHCTPSAWGVKNFRTSFLPVPCHVYELYENEWFIPHSRVSSGVLCFATTKRGSRHRFLFVIPSMKYQHNFFTSELVEIVNRAVQFPATITSHVDFDVYFAVPTRIENQFKQNIVGEVSGRLENGSEWSLGVKNVHIWTIGGLDRFY